MNDNKSNGEQGSKETFVVQIQFQDNATWQGSITWARKGQEVRFRSMLEMIKLMDDALRDDRKAE
ncbi:MAG: hypothetical protein ACK5LX_15130 [Oscillospiraceae bacterium]